MYEDGARIERVPEADVLLRLVDGCAFHGGRTRRTGGRPFLLHLQRRRSATRGRRETSGVDTRRRRVGHLRAKHSGRAYAPCAPGTRRGVRCTQSTWRCVRCLSWLRSARLRRSHIGVVRPPVDHAVRRALDLPPDARRLLRGARRHLRAPGPSPASSQSLTLPRPLRASARCAPASRPPACPPAAPAGALVFAAGRRGGCWLARPVGCVPARGGNGACLRGPGGPGGGAGSRGRGAPGNNPLGTRKARKAAGGPRGRPRRARAPWREGRDGPGGMACVSARWTRPGGRAFSF